MSDQHNHKARLEAAIKKEVLITHKQKEIISTQGTPSQWIFDFRNIVLQPSHLNDAVELFWETYKDRYPFQVGGLEVAAIPLITAIVMKSVERGMPVNGFFVRKSRKKSGFFNMIEGVVTDDPIILVDDIINSGRSFSRQFEALEVLNKANAVQDIFTLLRFRDVSYYKEFTERGITLTTVFTLDDFDLKYEEKTPLPPPEPLFTCKWFAQCGKPNLFYVVPKSAPVLYKDKVFLGSDSGYFWALRQSDGSCVWKKKVGWHPKGKSIFSTPALYQDTVYFGAYDGNVYALDADTGAKKWMFMEADWVGSSPALAPKLGLLFIGLEFGLRRKQGGIVALDMATGEKKWEHIMPEMTHGTPTFSSRFNVVAIGSNNHDAYLFEATEGRLLWKNTIGGDIKGAPAIHDTRSQVVFGATDGGVYFFDLLSGALLAHIATDFAILSTPLIEGNNVYVTSADKTIRCIDITTHEVRWVYHTTSRVFSTPVMIDGYLYVGTNDARLLKIDAATGTDHGFFQVSERITNKIAYNPETGDIFLPTFANELYCLTKKDRT